MEHDEAVIKAAVCPECGSKKKEETGSGCFIADGERDIQMRCTDCNHDYEVIYNLHTLKVTFDPSGNLEGMLVTEI